MQKLKIATFLAVSAMALGLSAQVAHAQPQPHPGGYGPQDRQVAPPDAGRHPAPPPQAMPRPQPQPQHQQHQQPQSQHQQHQQPQAMPKPGAGAHPEHRSGAGPDHRWERGTRLPHQYRGQQYVVNDWHRHGLKRPGRGQHWVQYGGDYMLVTIASGVIVQVILAH